MGQKASMVRFLKNKIKIIFYSLIIGLLIIVFQNNNSFCYFIGNKDEYKIDETAEGMVRERVDNTKQIAPESSEENQGPPPSEPDEEQHAEEVIGKELYVGPTIIQNTETKETGLDPIIKAPTISAEQETTPHYQETKGIEPTRKPKFDKDGNEIAETEDPMYQETWATYYYNSITQYGKGYNSPGMIMQVALKNPEEELDDYLEEVYQGLGIEEPQAQPKEVEENGIIPEAPHDGEYFQTITRKRLIKDFRWEHDRSNRWYLKKFIIDNYKDEEPWEEYFTGWQRIPYTEKIYDMWRYFDPETKAMSIGWKKVPLVNNPEKVGWYFFHPVIGCMQRGWLNYGGKKYYLVSDENSELYGSMLEGFWQIGNVIYYFERGSGEVSYQCSIADAYKYNIIYKTIV